MYIDGKVLDLLLRQVTPERILRKIIRSIPSEDSLFLADEVYTVAGDKDLFEYYAETTLYGYSKDEQQLLFKQLRENKNHWKENHFSASDFLYPIIQYAEDNLKLTGKDPVCKVDSILSWRDVFLNLGQDPFVCSFLAYKDYELGVDRSYFTWPAIIRVDNSELYQMLNRSGFAENHNHQKGGTFSFQITWTRLMNYPEAIHEEMEHFQKSMPLFAKTVRDKDDYLLTREEKLELAALIRSILFRSIHHDDFDSADGTVFSSEQAFFEEYVSAFSKSNAVNDCVELLRNNYGSRLAFPDNPDFCLDYMIDGKIMQNCVHSHLRVLTGERKFLYDCARACLGERLFSPFEQNLFYLYLVIQTNFRSEMIQANNHTGFHNFSDYQDRKDDAWEKNPYFWEAARISINYRLEGEGVTSFEGRLVPKTDADTNIDRVYKFDLAKRFADCPPNEADDHGKYNFAPDLAAEEFNDAPYFFLYHFIKKTDDRQLKENQFEELICRHQNHRQDLKNTAKALIEALQKSAYLRSRLRGIDASSNEFLCRPEVFAVAYRYMMRMQDKWNNAGKDFVKYTPMTLSKTYHAGEDFLDIAGGLRAIDEAIKFLELGSGCRIGHALALGVDPMVHYETKHFEIVTTKQERLDDLVWILYRTKELGIEIPLLLEAELREEAYHLYREIYGNADRKYKWNCNLEMYYCSMKLRGDDPVLYKDNKKYKQCSFASDEMSECLISNSDVNLNYYRNHEQIAGLYYYYQYGVHEGIVGDETYTKRISLAYAELMRNLQDGMSKFIDGKQIAIESNLSSNVLIGTFKSYDTHPILRFNDRKLGNKNQTQLLVCLNTDDLGVFDTSLEFEYALLYQTLREQVDENMNRKYTDRDIMSYLDDIREIGMRVTFPGQR